MTRSGPVSASLFRRGSRAPERPHTAYRLPREGDVVPHVSRVRAAATWLARGNGGLTSSRSSCRDTILARPCTTPGRKALRRGCASNPGLLTHSAPRHPRFGSDRECGADLRRAGMDQVGLNRAATHEERTFRQQTRTKLVAGLGFEPRQTDPESVVLPLHHPAGGIFRRKARRTLQGGCGQDKRFVGPTHVFRGCFPAVKWWGEVVVCGQCTRQPPCPDSPDEDGNLLKEGERG